MTTGGLVEGARLQTVVSSATRLFLIIADPIENLGSPVIYNSLFKAVGLDAVMLPWAVSSCDFQLAWAGLQKVKNLEGVVISMPHKTDMSKHVQTLEPQARLAGAVNVARRVGERWCGDLFDGVGVVAALRARGWRGRGTSALLIGCGGAGRAIACALARERIARLGLIDLDATKATELAAIVRSGFAELSCDPRPASHQAYDLIVNACPPATLRNDPGAASDEWLASRPWVVDIASGSVPSRLVERARGAGCPTVVSRDVILGQVPSIWEFLRLPALTADQVMAVTQGYHA